MIEPRFSPEINLGHLFQAAVVVLMMAPGYVSLVRDDARLDAEEKAIVSTQESEQAADILRLSLDEHRIDVADQKLELFESEMRKQYSVVLDRLGEIDGAMGINRPR